MYALRRVEDDMGPATGSPPPAKYLGPERRAMDESLMCAMDEIDFGIVLLTAVGAIHLVNRAAESELEGEGPLRAAGSQLEAREEHDAHLLRAALEDAGHRGLRRMLQLGCGVHQTSITVIPLSGVRYGAANVMLMLRRREFASPLAVEAFARSHRLTAAETRVLVALCHDKSPQQIAKESNLEISTIRSQLSSLRQKTGTQSIRSLVTQVAILPPFSSILAPSCSGRATPTAGVPQENFRAAATSAVARASEAPVPCCPA